MGYQKWEFRKLLPKGHYFYRLCRSRHRENSKNKNNFTSTCSDDLPPSTSEDSERISIPPLAMVSIPDGIKDKR